MPKMKTHRGAHKRFRITGTGKVRRNSAHSSHLFSAKTAKQKRDHRKAKLVSEAEQKRIRMLIPYK